MNNEQWLNNYLTDMQKRLTSVRKELSCCPKGKLYQQSRGENSYFIQSYYVGNKQVHKGVSSKPDVVIGLIRRRLLERELKVLENNVAAVKLCRKKLQSFWLSNEIEKIKARCPNVTDSMITEAVRPGSFCEWERESYEQSSFMVEGRTQVTRDGLKVRSKSELLIAEILHEYGLPFRYEQVLTLNGVSFAPDFTILKPDNSLYYWEHFGMTSVKEYMEHQSYKLKTYAEHDIVPWKNLIITYDDADGSVDLRIIRAEIETKLLL